MFEPFIINHSRYKVHNLTTHIHLEHTAEHTQKKNSNIFYYIVQMLAFQ